MIFLKEGYNSMVSPIPGKYKVIPASLNACLAFS
jgi:hypothetical protein